MQELWLVCEGRSDRNVLAGVFTDLSADIAVEPAGGIEGVRAVAQYLRAQRGGVVASIADRDYRRLEEAEASFGAGSSNFLWPRHSIENYLLQPEVVAMAFTSLKTSVA